MDFDDEDLADAFRKTAIICFAVAVGLSLVGVVLALLGIG